MAVLRPFCAIRREILIRRPTKQRRYTTFSQECYDDPGVVESFDLRRQSLREVPASIGYDRNLDMIVGLLLDYC